VTKLHKAARDLLMNAKRSEFERILTEAKVPPIYEDVARLHIVSGLTLYQIAMNLNISERTARKYLATVYDRAL